MPSGIYKRTPEMKIGRHKGSKNKVSKKIKKICPICKKIFYIYPFQIRINRGKYCSIKCMGIAQAKVRKGHQVSQECREKISKHLKGRFTGNRNPSYGKKGEKAHGWKGGRIKGTNGYIDIYKPKHPFCNNAGYVREHRLIIEAQIGRYLLPEEECHHINKIRDDNRLENLMAFISKSIHQQFHHNPQNVKPEDILFDGRKIL